MVEDMATSQNKFENRACPFAPLYHDQNYTTSINSCRYTRVGTRVLYVCKFITGLPRKYIVYSSFHSPRLIIAREYCC
jgi:hypothetical protein